MPNKSMEVELQQLLTCSNIEKIQDQPPPDSILEKVRQKLDSTAGCKSQTNNKKTQIFWGFISPTESRLLIWDCIVLIAIYVFLFEMGFVLAFGAQFWIDLKDYHYTVALYVLILSVFILDIAINFHKGYYKLGEGRIIIDRRSIIRNYLKKYFWIDITTLVIVIIPLVVTSDLNGLQILFLAKFLKKRSYEKEVLRQLEENSTLTQMFSLIILLIDAGLISHYIAAIFLRIDTALWNQQYYGDNTNLYWLSNNADYGINLMDGPWYQQYIYAQDFSTGTLSTLAPGPFPKNPIEVVYANAVMIFLIILSSFLADGIVRIFYEGSEQRGIFQTNILTFINFLELKDVSPSVKYKTQNYFESVWEVEGKTDREAEQRAIQKLSTKLQQQLMLEIFHLKTLKFLSYFRRHYNDLEVEVSKKIVESLTDSDQILFQPKGDEALQHKVYLISVGQAKLFFSHMQQETIISLTNVQKVLGVYQFVTGADFCYSAKTIHLTHYHQLDKQDFMAILGRLKLTETFQQLKYRVQAQQKLSLIGRCCLACLGSHLEIDCPSIMYEKRIQNMVVDRSRLTDNDREQFRRADRSNRRTVQASTGVTRTPKLFQLMNLFLVDKYIHDLIVYEVFEQSHNFDNYLPEGNLKALLE